MRPSKEENVDDKERAGIDGRVSKGKTRCICLIFTHMSVPGYISPAVPHHEIVAHPRSGAGDGRGSVT